MLRLLVILIIFSNALASNRTQELSKINKVCEALQTKLCINDSCPSFCYDKYEHWHHNPDHMARECILRCTPTDMCLYTGMPRKNETALDRQLREQMIMCMKEETGEIDKEELEPDAPVDTEKHEWAAFRTEEFSPLYKNGHKILESKKPKDDEEEKPSKKEESPKDDYVPTSCKAPEKTPDKEKALPKNGNGNSSKESSPTAMNAVEVVEHGAKKRKPIDSIERVSAS